MRWFAFWGFGILCVLFLLILMVSLAALLVDRKILAVITHASDWHFVALLSVAILALTSVPLTLSIALVKMISHSHKSSDAMPMSLTTPQIEFFKLIVEAIKTVTRS